MGPTLKGPAAIQDLPPIGGLWLPFFASSEIYSGRALCFRLLCARPYNLPAKFTDHGQTEIGQLSLSRKSQSFNVSHSDVGADWQSIFTPSRDLILHAQRRSDPSNH
jgi:hypothetical protein